MVPDVRRNALVAELRQPCGWRFMICHPPDHLSAEAIRMEGEEGVSVPLAPPFPPAGGHEPGSVEL
jgi:hypothetical protein